MSCASARPEDLSKVHLQYRIASEYLPNTTTPNVRAYARAYSYERWDSKKNPRFELNGLALNQVDRGVYLRNDVPVVGQPFILEWSIYGYTEEVVILRDTVEPPLTISDYASGDTVSKTTGFALLLEGVSGNTTKIDEAGITGNVVKEHASNERLFCMIVGQNEDGTALLTDKTRTMFDQPNDGQLEITPALLSSLSPNIKYKLVIERGRSNNAAGEDVGVVSNSFTEASTYFYLTD
jgi:hypothetical protein